MSIVRREGAPERRPQGPVDVVLDLAERRAVAPTPRRATSYLPYKYDVAGLVTIGSEIPLRELEYFREPTLGRDLDIRILRGDIGHGLRTRTKLTARNGSRSVAYEEHLGSFGANFQVRVAEHIDVIAGSLLARSPHVLYTNVIEALLRFVMVKRDHILLHSACMDFDGYGVMLSARTDTGKTGTVLRLLRERRAKFLSDDMTIVSMDGRATTFPKPMTISQHTLRAIDVTHLSKSEWTRLRVQSRIHSKEGRNFGVWLATANLPIMSVNALTQMVIPPPKYPVDRLVECEFSEQVDARDLFIIERGHEDMTELSTDEAVTELIANTDDAYGFPPFRYLAPQLVIGNDDYESLRVREEEILRSALRGIRVRRLGSNNFGWADSIPAILEQERSVTATADVAMLAPGHRRTITLPDARQEAGQAS